ncbi:MAG: nucleotidyltransferase domain-containing protein [Nanoarchaeota archaeon]
MKSENSAEIMAYASTFVSYLVGKLGEKVGYIDAFILYGSVAKGEATPQSDIDLFIDTKYPRLEKKIQSILSLFLTSRQAALFNIIGVANEISIKVGELYKWKSLYSSIQSTGIVLWMRYGEKELSSRPYTLFYWESIGKNRGAFLNKLYGVKGKRKRYAGLVETIGGRKVGKSAILVPTEKKELVIVLFKKYLVAARQVELFLRE